MAEQNNTLHKGWLTTRDGAKFAPATLIENVFSRDGTSYDTKIKEYIQNEIQDVDGDLTEAVQTINDRVNTLDSKVDNSVQALESKDTEIENKLSNFGDDQGDKLYIVDKDDNVIAYVDQNGVTSTNFIVPGVTNFQAEHEAVEDLKERMQTAESDIDDIETALRNIDVNADDDTFYIIDSQENVIAYINGEGVHSINFIVDNEDSEYANYLALLEKVESHIEEIKDLKEVDGGLRQDLTDFADAVNKKLQYFNGDEDEVFFFVDNSDNVIAYIDQYGIHTTGLYATDSGLTVEDTLYVYNKIGETIFTATSNDGISVTNLLIKAEDGTTTYNLVDTLKSLIQEDGRLSEALGTTNQKLNKEISDRAEEDGKLQEAIDDTNARTQYIDGTDDEVFYIIDKADNVIAYINDGGVHSTNFLIDDQKGTVHNVKDVLETLINEGELQQSALTSLSQALQKEVNDRVADVNQEESDRKAAVLAEAQAREQADNTEKQEREKAVSDEANTRATADETLQSNIDDEEKARKTADNALQSEINETNARTAHLDGTEDERLYIIDKNDNVIAYIDAVGVHAIEFITEPYTTGANPRATRYEMTELGDSVEALEAWRPNAQREIDRNEDDITRLYGMVGEDRTQNIANGYDHKSRLDKIDDILDLESFDANGKSNRLDRLDTLVGDINDTANAGAVSHEARLKSLRDDLSSEIAYRRESDRQDDVAFEQAVNYRGRSESLPANATEGDLFTHVTASGEQAKYFDGTSWQPFEGLSHKLYYIDGTASDKFYIVDPNGNVVAYFGAEGLVTTDLWTHGVIVNNDGVYATDDGNLSGNTPISLNAQIVDLQNRMSDKTARVASLENRLSHVQQAMSFEGVKDAKPDPKDYQPGDVIVVSKGEDSGKEFVLDAALGWVEIGYSDYTKTAIDNLRTVVGRDDNQLPSSGHNANMNHEQRLNRLDDLVGYNVDTPTSTSHEGRIRALDERLNTESNERVSDVNNLNTRRRALEQSVNFLGLYETDASIGGTLGDLAVFGTTLKIYNGSAWEAFNGLSHKLYYIDGTDDDTFYITDSSSNVIAYFDSSGLTVTNLRIQDGVNNTMRTKDSIMFIEPSSDRTYDW